MLSIKKLEQKFKDRHILKSISLTIEPQRVTALLGPNGAGKTTLLKTVMGLLPSQEGVYLENQLISPIPTHTRVAKGLVYLPQHSSLFQQLSVIDNLSIVHQYHPCWADKTKESFIEEVESWFLKTGLTCPFDQKAQGLSGGQKRKLEVIRTILMRPKIAMFDEPFAGVDPKSIYELKEIFSNMAHKQSIAVVVSDHNVDQLLSIANYTYVIINGEVVTQGSIKEILDDNKTKDAYFGNQFYSEISQRYT